MITIETIIYPEEYWMNSQLSTARFFGGCKIKGNDLKEAKKFIKQIKSKKNEQTK